MTHCQLGHGEILSILRTPAEAPSDLGPDSISAQENYFTSLNLFLQQDGTMIPI